MTERHKKILQEAVRLFPLAVKPVLASRISEHYSEQEWNEIVSEAAARWVEYAATSTEMSDLAAAGDLEINGKINAQGILDVLEKLVEAHQGKPTHPTLFHLTRYFQHTMKEAKLLKA